MGGRVTRTPQSRELVRAKGLRQALESGAAPAFVAPVGAVSDAPSSSLSWATGPVTSSTSKKPGSAENLEIRRQYLEQLFQSCPDPLIIVDASFRALCINQEFQRLFGYSAAQIMGQSIEALILPAGRKVEFDWTIQCLRRGEHLTLETQRRRKDGTLLDVSLTCAPLIIHGRTAAFYAVYRDISERKRAESLSSALYRIAERASATQDLQQFFSAVHAIVDELVSPQFLARA